MTDLNNHSIIDNFDKIIYSDLSGEILYEQRILNASHPHDYFNIRNNMVQTIKLDNQDYRIVEARIDYVEKIFGTIRITHLKLSPFTDGQHY